MPGGRIMPGGIMPGIIGGLIIPGGIIMPGIIAPGGRITGGAVLVAGGRAPAAAWWPGGMGILPGAGGFTGALPLVAGLVMLGGGAGPSISTPIMFSPRSRTSPSVRFSTFVFSSPFLTPFTCTVRNSSHSPNTKFINLSKAKNVPISTLVSSNVTFTR